MDAVPLGSQLVRRIAIRRSPKPGAVGIEGACDVIIRMAEQQAFAKTEDSQKVMDDAALISRVWVALATDPSTGGANLKVDGSDGAIVVTGTVESDELQDAVVAVARRVDGVKAVECRLKVRPPIYDIGL